MGPEIYSIGYGNREWKDFITLLQAYSVDLLVDVRSVPHSLRYPCFSRGELSHNLAAEGIEYHWLGDLLGGRPDQSYLYDDLGYVDYQACREDLLFQRGFQRLEQWLDDGRTVAFMCSELRPEECHRSRIVGQAMNERGFKICHIDETGTIIDQSQIQQRLSGGQDNLWGEINPRMNRSDRPLRPPELTL